MNRECDRLHCSLSNLIVHVCVYKAFTCETDRNSKSPYKCQTHKVTGRINVLSTKVYIFFPRGCNKVSTKNKNNLIMVSLCNNPCSELKAELAWVLLNWIPSSLLQVYTFLTSRVLNLCKLMPDYIFGVSQFLYLQFECVS